MRAFDRFDSDSLLLQLRRDGLGDLADAPFATAGDETFTLGEFQTWFGRQNVRPAPDQRAQVMEGLGVYLDEQGFELALSALEERDPAFRNLLQQYVDGVLLFRISEDSVWTPAAEDEAGLRAYYASRQETYRWPERRRVLAFSSPSDSLLTAVAADLDRDQNPTAILSSYNDDEPVAPLRLDTLYVADSTGTPLDAVLGLEPGAHTDVMPERSRRAVYLLDAIEPPRAKRFDEARAELVTGYQDELEAAWVERLRAHYNARTYPQRVKAAFN